MKKFMSDDFLLSNKTAEYLYNNHAKNMPIYDFHCHLTPQEIYEDKKYSSITEVWLGGDHYKWRALRTNGVSEDYITGSKSEREKFNKWAETIPYTIGNPLYHWTHMELKKYFGIEEQLNPKTEEKIWNESNLKLENLTARKMIELNNVKAIFTTDDPTDDLNWHLKMKEDSTLKTKVLPTFRPDKAINIDLDWFTDWIIKLSEVVGYEINTLQLLTNALLDRINFFHEIGCRASDHALDVVQFEKCEIEEAEVLFQKGLHKEKLSINEIKKYKGYILNFLGQEYAKRDWVMQLHIGALRNNSQRMLEQLGPDTGFDSINDQTFAEDLTKLLDSLDNDDLLPKTILYCLNPRDNEVLATIAGSFQGGGIPGKIQFGSAWWFNDQIDGMKKHLEALAQLGLLSRFVGMLTDSRSFLSYPRHDYFRRILCDKIGALVENGEYPNDLEFLGKIIEDICYNNAFNYFGISL